MLAAALGIAACSNDDTPPFALWAFRAGMPLTALDSMALHTQHERFTCVNSYGTFRSCTIQSLGSFGIVQAIIDSTGHAVLVAFKPDMESLMGFDVLLVGLERESRNIRARWNQIAEPQGDPLVRPPRRAEVWSSRSGRWSARLVWQKDGYPQEFRVADARAMRTWSILADKAEADSMARLALAPLAEQAHSDPQVFADLLSLELKRLVDAQIAYHDTRRTYTTDLSALKFAPRSKVHMTIGGADPFGFWARATHDLLPDRTCNIFIGEPPRAPAQLGHTEGQPVCLQM